MIQDQREVRPVSQTDGQIRSSYDRISRWYDLLAGGFERRFSEAARQMLIRDGEAVILEIGVGSGRAILALAGSAGPSARLYGMDLSTGMLDIARGKVQKAGLAEQVTLVQGDARRLPFRQGFTDRILMSFVLELFDTAEIALVLSECHRTLRPKGRICIVAMSKKGRPNPMMKLYEWLHLKLPQYIDCRPIDAQAVLERSGFHTLAVSLSSLLGLHTEIILSEKT